LAGPHLWSLSILYCGAREPLYGTGVHRLGCRRGFRGIYGGERGIRLSIPAEFSDEEAAPLLCAGIIGYRALRRAQLPAGGRLGIYGFGGSAHLIAQIALADGARVHVLTRSQEDRALALELGVSSAGAAEDLPPEPLDSAILFAPVGTLVPVALTALDRGGTLAIAGIHLTDVPALNYQRHLFEERSLCSVTANTRQDGNEFLARAARIPLRVHTVPYRLDQADEALADLAHDRFGGAAVLVNSVIPVSTTQSQTWK
jgi:propanol-preferring alcohol dehydrogenase